MKQMRTLVLFLVVVFVSFSVAYAEFIKNDSFRASSDDVNVTLSWLTEDETSVAHFEIERRTITDGAFVSIATLDPKGASLYEFVDYSAFRKATSIYQYRIKIVFSNGASPVYVGPLTVPHTVSGVRRTWGSIKSMFR